MDYSQTAQAWGPSPVPPPSRQPQSSAQKERGTRRPPPLRLQIDEAVMSLGKVLFVDYGTGRRVEKNFDFAIDRMRLKNVTDMPSLTQQVTLVILQKIGVMALGEQVGRLAGEFFDEARGKLAGFFS